MPPHTFLLMGGTGDLTRRKLLPALYRLHQTGALAHHHRVIAVSRDTGLGDDQYRAWAAQALADAGEDVDASWCGDCLFHVPVRDPADYADLASRLREIEGGGDGPNRVIYMALPPRAFGQAAEALAAEKLHRSGGWTRLVTEKPFGEDLDSAVALNRHLHQHFTEDQIYRIDHYLGKETVQNLLVFRFTNAMFESLWNRNHIDNVQITVAETVGVAGRAGYYDGVGALRDMVQNHLTQLVALVGMEIPVAYESAAVRNEKVKVLRAIRAIETEDVIYGQYAPGSIEGHEVAGYLQESGMPEGSNTETFVATALRIDNWRWQGVPFYLRTGKRMARRTTEIAVTFKRPPVSLFENLNWREIDHDVLLITLQPDEGFSLFFDLKRPGEPLQIEKMPLEFRYEEAFGPLPDAYTTLLADILDGDQTLFVHAEEVEASWRLYTPLLERNIQPHAYPAGSWGPQEADRLPARHGNVWRTL